ncbi:olfactory receptor 140-like [Neolamprologus brichardi]|uniref:olfactory receptor 140-like n=1 Tax=Neolamprologus brichardi TaxID=32507 RepID=UPI001643DB15|nr:olfactory receptor 140-like [Neolamprologus brichardi]
MDNKLNLTYITLNGYVEVEKYRYVYFLIIFTIYAAVIFSNSTIICLILFHQSLHEPMYIFIAALLLQRCREVRKKAAQTCLPHLLVLFNYSFFCTCEVIILRLESDISQTVRLIMTLQVVLYHPLFNPIIYGLKMKKISKHLKRLFC